jgi:hypothetical protein
VTATPFIHHCPKDPRANLEWRLKLRRAALHDVALQHALYDACMSDVLFFFNFALWVYEPRARVKVKPFVTWPNQDPSILAMDQVITESEATESPIALPIKKSRAQGLTYIFLGVIGRRWLRDQMFSAGLVTRNEKLVDSPTDQSTLLWKLAWMLDQLPFWMLPKGYGRSLSDHSISNPLNGATIVGYAAGADVDRGGRKTVFVPDEFGSTDFISGGKDYKVMDSLSHVTNCIIMPSTFGGESGVFYETATDPENPRVMTVDWKDNPTQTKNAYIRRNGITAAVRPEEQAAVNKYVKDNAAMLRKLERRGHAMEGKFRSPWYDAYCLLPGATPRSIARELDMDPRGAVGKVFDIDVLDKMKEKNCKPPVWQGKPVFDEHTKELKGLIRQEGGPLKLWFKPGPDNAPPHGQFALGCDISAGGKSDISSNSVICGVDRATGEQVLEYTILGTLATFFAREAFGFSKWLRNAYLGWEATGPTGGAFADEVVEVLRYGNIYFRPEKEAGNFARTRKAGWWNGGDDDKGRLFENLCVAMQDEEFTPRSEDMVRECGEYEWEDGKIVHRASKAGGAAGKAHGDRCVAAGVAWLLCKDRPINRLDKTADEGQDYPWNSPGWRRKRRQDAKRQLEVDDWQDSDDPVTSEWET